MTYRITLPDGSQNTIVADEAFVEANYPGRWELLADTEAATPSDHRVTKLAFRNRFTQAEKVALELASLDKPSGTPAERQMAASIRSYLKDVDAANWIDLSRTETVAGVQSLEAGGLIAAGRAAAILTAPILESERPQ